MQVMCSKGCGHAITITQEMIDEATKSGSALNVSHDVCPNSPDAKQRNYRIELAVFEVIGTGQYDCQLCGIPVEETVDGWFHNIEPDTEHAVIPQEFLQDELLTRFGNTVSGGSFKLAVPRIGDRLQELWGRVLQMQDILSEEPGQVVMTQPDDELPPADADVEPDEMQVEEASLTNKEGK